MDHARQAVLGYTYADWHRLRNCSVSEIQHLSSNTICKFEPDSLYEHCAWLLALIWIIYLPFNAHALLLQPRKVRPNALRTVKITCAFILAFLNIVFFVKSSSDHRVRAMSATIAYGLLTCIVTLSLVPIVYLEDERNARPSLSLSAYLFLSISLDFAHLWSLLLRQDAADKITALAIFIASKCLLFALENGSKRSFLLSNYTSLPPEATSGIVNRSFLWWLNSLLIQGTRGVIKAEDLFDLDGELRSSILLHKLLGKWESRTRPEWRLTLVIVLCRTFGNKFIRVIFPRLCLIGFTFAQPFLITAVLNFLTKEDNTQTRMEGYGLILSAVIIYSGIAFSQLHAGQNLFRFITMFRGAAVSLIYNRSLLLSEDSQENSAVVSLMSTDVDRISQAFELLNECWSRIIELCIGIPLLAFQLGWVSVMPLIVVLVSSIGSNYVAKNLGDRQAEWAKATQVRLSMTNTVLNEIKGIKMTGLQEKASDILQNQRIKETKLQEKYTWAITWLNVVCNIPFGFAPAATFIVYAIQSYIRGTSSLDIVKAFTSLAIIRLVSDPASRLLSAVPQVVASVPCFERIQTFLLAAERSSDIYDKQIADDTTDDADADALIDILIDIDPPTSSDFDHTDSLAVISKTLSMTHPDGRGILLEDVNFTIQKGSVIMITGPAGGGKSVLLSHIMGERVARDGHITTTSKIIGYCSQTPWIPNGTIKQIICGTSDESAIDEKRYGEIIKACSLSRDLADQPKGDATVSGSRGSALSGGQKQRVALARALYNGSDMMVLDDPFSGLDNVTQSEVFDNLFGAGGILKESEATVILVTHNVRYLQVADSILIVGNHRVRQGTYEELLDSWTLRSYGSNAHDAKSSAPEKGDTPTLAKLEVEVPTLDTEIDDLRGKMGNLEAYKYYFKSIGAWNFGLFLFFTLVHVLSASLSSVWLKWWADADGGHALLFILGYIALSVGYSTGIGGFCWAIAVIIGPSTGRTLHAVLLRVVMNAPMSFLTATETGMILNRFSQDMALIEMKLCTGLLATVTNLLGAVANAALIATGSYYMALSLPFTLLTIYYLQKFYVRTSRQLRILELESRSPIYSLFLETLEGLATIRGFKWQRRMVEEHERRLDESQKPYYLMFCIQQWLSLVLSLMIAGIATAVVALATTLRFSTNAGLLGVSMNAILAFNQSISQFINGWTLLETSMGAISRLQDLEADVLPEEEPKQPLPIPPGWPTRGRVEFKGVSASYGTSFALDNINLMVEPGQHLAIRGRTGSGKSSLITTILRILPTSSGTITIDSVNVKDVPLSTLRQHITTIPQDFIHLPGSVRFNLDPFQRNNEMDIETALQRVGLWGTFSTREGLETTLTPDVVSGGQLKLLALARAVLQHTAQPSALLVLDEVTSNLDFETESMFFQILKEVFGGCTVISVAHRQQAIDAADSVVVMENGRINPATGSDVSS